MTTAAVYVPAKKHTKPGHPENEKRIGQLLPFLEKEGVLADVPLLAPARATVKQLRRIHAAPLIERVREVATAGGGILDHGDTYATAQSYELARMAAGSTIALVDHILTGQVKNGFALIRPPGHHAEYGRISGFCLFNNVAAAARQAEVVHGVKRILILDLDVHHGNGTQDIFYNDESVMFISTHLFMPRMFYPGTGDLQELGHGYGHGYTVNVPLAPNVGDVGYGRVFSELIEPMARQFKPELILVSVGYDAHWQDPLAMAGLSLTGYGRLSQALVTLAEELCHGRILFVLEGGYQLQALSYGILNTFYALLGQDKIDDPMGFSPREEQDISQLLRQLKRHHLIY